jgi:GxxExxY protein
MPLGFRADIIVNGIVIVEIKAVQEVAPVHAAQLITYLKLSDCKVGLLINFYVIQLKSGISRFVHPDEWRNEHALHP